MANKRFWLGMLAMALVFTMALVGCDTGSGGGDGNGGLPAAKGANAVSGKTYYNWYIKIVFSATADGAKNGTYTKWTAEEDDDGDWVLDSNGKYKYADIETGIYTWDEEAKTVALKPEKVANVYNMMVVSPLQDEAGFRKTSQAMLESIKAEMGEAYFNQFLLAMGFSSLGAYLDYEVKDAFSSKTNSYSFSTDGTALFLEQALPANKGTNEFTDQTYSVLFEVREDGGNREIVEYCKVVFTASGCTVTDGGYTTTGTYAYDSSIKYVWLRFEKIDGKGRQEIYAETTARPGHEFVDDNAYRAAQVNSNFVFWSLPYNSTTKTIMGGCDILIDRPSNGACHRFCVNNNALPVSGGLFSPRRGIKPACE